MTTIGTFTVAGQADLRQRLSADGLASLGLAGPLLSPVWTQTKPAADVARLRFSPAAPWFAPIGGMLFPVPDASILGLSGLDGKPAVSDASASAMLSIHPQARLRLERALVANLETNGVADQSRRPVPSTILIHNIPAALNVAQLVRPGELAMPAGEVSFHDERGLIVDPFAFAAVLDALLQVVQVLRAPMPTGATAGTPAVIAGLAPAGRFVHAVDLHGRPWADPPGGTGTGIGFFTGPPNNQAAGRLADGTLQPWPSGTFLAAEADPTDAQRPRLPTTCRIGWSTVGTLDTAPLTWPMGGARQPVRDTMRVAAVDLPFHLAGNRSTTTRDGVIRSEPMAVAEQQPQVRDGSPVTLLADGRAVLGSFGQVMLSLQGGNPAGPFTSGPLFAATVAFDDEFWPLPVNPGPAGRWPQTPAAVPLTGTPAAILAQLQTMRGSATAAWIAGTNNVLVTLTGLPNGVFLRLYPREVKLGQTLDEQPLLVRHDGGGAFVAGGNARIVLLDPFSLGSAPAARPAGAKLRADAAAVWMPQGGPPAQVHILGSLAWPVGPDVPAPPPLQANILKANFWKSNAPAPILGAPTSGSFNLGVVLADPIAFVTAVVRQLSTDQNPRTAPRLPTMARTETIIAVQMPAGTADPYRAVLTGGWLTREIDAHTYRAANPGGVGEHEVHAPGIAASSQLGFDLWVAAAHRCRPIVPLADVAAAINGQANNWILLQANAASNPPLPPATPSTVAGVVLQTVPAYVETPELALVPDDDVPAVEQWIANQLGTVLNTPNDPELHRQMVREVRTAKYGRRDAQWALRRAIQQARELVYIETPLFGATYHAAGNPVDPKAAAELVEELASRLVNEPRLRAVILLPRAIPFPQAFDPFSAFFYDSRNKAAGTLTLAGGTMNGYPRVVVAHPMGMPGRPLVIRTTTVIVDDVFCFTGTSSFCRRGLTFDGGLDVAMMDRALDRGVGVRVRAHRKALMAAHLDLAPPASPTAVPSADWVCLHQAISAHRVFADLLASGGNAKLLPLWQGPDFKQPGAAQPHPADVADPDGRGGDTLVRTIAGALAGNGVV